MKLLRLGLSAAIALLVAAAATSQSAAPGPEFDIKKQKWGFRDAMGKWKVKPQFFSIQKQPEGGYLVEKEGRKGYYNASFERVAPADFDTLAVGHTGYVMVRKEGRWGLIAPDGRTTIKPRYASMTMAPSGMLCVGEKGAAGIVDTDNRTVLPIIGYTLIEPFSNEFLHFVRGEEQGLLDQMGHEKIPGGRYSSYIAHGNDFIEVTSYGKTGMLDGLGREIIAPLNDRVSRWLDKYFMVETMGKKGVYSLEGRPLIPSQYDSIVPVNEAQNRFILTFGNKKGLSGIDEMILPCEFSSIEVLPSGELKAVRQGVANLYTYKGKPAYTREMPVGDGLRAMSNDTSQLVIVDADFNQIVPMRRGHIAVDRPLILIEGTGDLPILLNPRGKKLIEANIPAYEMASDADEYSIFFNYQPLEKPADGRFTVFDRKGTHICNFTIPEAWQIANDTVGDPAMKPAIERLVGKLRSLYEGAPTETGKLVNINDIWIRDNATRGMERGLEVHLSFNISGSQYNKCVAEAYFVDSEGSALTDTDGKFADSEGLVRASAAFMPEEESTDIADLVIFMPYKQLHTNTTARFDGWTYVTISSDGEMLASTDFVNFTVASKGTAAKSTSKKRRSYNIPGMLR